MLVSVIIPAYRAEATIVRAVKSVLDQSCGKWEAIVVADDGTDYADVLRASGIADRRLRFVSSGGVRSGCHRARNVGLVHARGDCILHFDADDVCHPERLERLLPLALARGAALDNARVVDDATGVTISTLFPDGADRELDLAAFLDTNIPVFPLIRRDHAQSRLEGIELMEDVVANLRLIARIGLLPVVGESLFDYRVMPQSLSTQTGAADRFDETYAQAIVRLMEGDGLALPQSCHTIVSQGLMRKRALNSDYRDAERAQPGLSFQAFIARTMGAPAIANGSVASPSHT